MPLDLITKRNNFFFCHFSHLFPCQRIFIFMELVLFLITNKHFFLKLLLFFLWYWLMRKHFKTNSFYKSKLVLVYLSCSISNYQIIDGGFCLVVSQAELNFYSYSFSATPLTESSLVSFNLNYF